MRIYPCLSVLVLATTALISGCQQLPRAENDLTWQEQGGASWRIHGDQYEALGNEDGYLVSEDSLGDYSLTIDFWVDDEANSGVFVHCQDADDITPLTCFEFNIWDDHPNQAFRTGALVTIMSPLARVETAGRWNTYHLKVGEHRIEAYINGTLVSYIDSPDKQSGHIALQRANRGAVKFRNLKLTENGQ